MPLDALYLVVLFACGYSLIQPRLSTDEFFPRFRWSCLTSQASCGLNIEFGKGGCGVRYDITFFLSRLPRGELISLFFF